MATSLIPLGLFCAFAYFLPRVTAGETFHLRFDWIPSLGIHFSLLIDGLSLLFALVVCGVGFFVVLYAAKYLGSHAPVGKFYFYLHGFMLAMLGLVLAEDLLVLFVFWELTTLFSYLLIGFEHGADTARANARQALLVTGAGGLALLIGILLLGTVVGTYALTGMPEHIGRITHHRLYLPILLIDTSERYRRSASS